MIPTSQNDVSGFFCAECNLKFGAIPDSEGVIRCPLCRKATNRNSREVVRLSDTIFQCGNCGLKFGAVPKDGEPVQCPICATDQKRKGG